jgi:hypothetical protein
MRPSEKWSRWDLPIRSYKRVGVGFLVLLMSTLLLPVVSPDPNLTVYGGFGGVLAVGCFIGFAVRRKRDAFAVGFLAGIAAVWLGFFISVPVVYLLAEAVSLWDLCSPSR